MHPIQTVEFWHNIFNSIQEGNIATTTIVDPGTGEVITDIGDVMSADTMTRLEHLRKSYQHARLANTGYRQICCKTCHDCGNPLITALDGELWCATCERYW